MTTIHLSEPPVAPFLAGQSVKPMLIDGEWVEASSGETYETVNPATARTLVDVSAAGTEDVDRAVRAARRAFEDPAWSGMRPRDRTLLLLRVAEAIEQHADELAVLDSLEAGHPISVTRGMPLAAANTFRYYAGWPTKMTGTVNPTEPNMHSYTVRTPIGVCAGIIPWNAPLSMAAWKTAPALATGNTVILKPAEQVALSVLRLGEILLEAGVPAGVVNVVTGLGPVAGAAIAAHPDVDKIAFTGSTTTGKTIVRAASETLTRVTLELGGKSPHIICADADVPSAAAATAAGFLGLSGQMCMAGTRILVHESVREEFVAELRKRIDEHTVGDPFDADTTLGPLVSAQQFERVTGYLDLGRAEGARVSVGGTVPDSPGYFVEPTVFEDVNNGMRLAREEIFGPVTAIMPFCNVEDAIAVANDTEYGLAAAVATKDVSQAHRIAARLQAGTVWVNTYGVVDVGAPYGGFKQSGLGRELGEESLANFTELKTVMVQL